DLRINSPSLYQLSYRGMGKADFTGLRRGGSRQTPVAVLRHNARLAHHPDKPRVTVPPTSIVLLVLVPFIAWRLYARTRRHIGRQKSKAWRHWAAAIFFPLVILILTATTWVYPLASVGLAGGVALGALLALWGLRLTRFEHAPEGFFY